MAPADDFLFQKRLLQNPLEFWQCGRLARKSLMDVVREPPNACAHVCVPRIFPPGIQQNYWHFGWFGIFGRFANRPYMAFKRDRYFDREYITIAFFELAKSKIETENQRHWLTHFKIGEAPDDAPEYIKKAGLDESEIRKLMH